MDCDNGIEELGYIVSTNSEDLFHLSGAFYDSLNIKVAFLLFVVYILLNTDIFAESVLRKISKDAYDMSSDKITPKGIIVSAMMLSLFYIVVDLLADAKVI